MRHHRLAWIVAATAITAAPFTPAAAAAATPVPDRAIGPADVTATTVVKHVNTDVDGDGTRDSVDLSYLGSDKFELAVTTTKGKTSKVAFTSHVEPGMVPAAQTWYGADAIDGRKGSELIVHLYDPSVTDSGQNLDIEVYTWRAGHLVVESAPAAATGTGWQVGVTEGSEGAAGYWFFTSHGRRYVDTSRLTTGEWPWHYQGSITRSVWRNGKWAKVSTRTARTKAMPDGLTWKQVGMAGPKLLRAQVKADINGDRRTDLALIYQLGPEHYRVTVLAHGRKASADATYWTNPFIGATAVDGVAGDELIAISATDSRWTVLTWRHSGTLTKLKGPALYGEVGNREWRAAAQATTNFALSVEGGLHYVTTGWIDDGASIQSDPVHFAKSVWQSGHWNKLTEWSAVMTDEQRAAFHQGFTAPGLISL
jgi:hypothetical protein